MVTAALAPATRHTASCRCIECIQRHYALEQTTRADRLQQEVSRLETELAMVRRQLALSEYRRLTAATHLAIARNDKVAHARAISERMGCEVSHVDADVIHREFEEAL